MAATSRRLTRRPPPPDPPTADPLTSLQLWDGWRYGSRGWAGYRPAEGSGEINAMPVTISCPQLYDAALRTRLHDAVAAVIKRARPSFEAWKFSLFQSQSGAGWDLAISGPRFRKVFTLYGPADDLPGLVSAYVDAIITHRE